MTANFFTSPEPARAILRVAGADRVEFLQGLVSNDVTRAGPDRAIWAALLTPQGKYLFDFFILATPDALLLDVEAGRATDLLRRLAVYRLRAKVTIEADAKLETWLGWGDGAAARFGLDGRGAARSLDGAVVYADPRLGELGIRIVAPAGAAPGLLGFHGFEAGRFADWDRLRITLGVPDGSRDLVPEKSILLESGFDELDGVAWDKGCYIGQELTARTKYRGLVKKRLMPVAIEGAVPVSGSILADNGQELAEMRSAQGDLGLALVRLDALSRDALVAGETRLTPRPPGWLTLPSGGG